MSCTVVAVPYALMWVVGAIATAAASASVGMNSVDPITTNEDVFDFNTNQTKECDDTHIITEKHFIEKTFETPFMDKSILLKTLEEHGVKNIFEWETGLSGEVNNYKLIFEKPALDKPYTVKISCLEQDNAEEKVGDLNNEYAMNVQEDAYLHIIDKLKENNMQIEEEEVMEDNTIVLTVNIE